MHTRLLAAAILASLPWAATAQDRIVPSYGFALTSDYMSKGQTQSDHNPALQGYAEARYGLFYGGLWASTVDFNTADSVEFDVYAGVRPSFGGANLDISYLRYLYDDSGDCCGEFKFDVAYPIEDIGLVGAYFAYDNILDTKWLEARAEYYFADVWYGSVDIGNDFGSLDLGSDRMTAYDVGFGRALGDIGKVDLRFYDSNYTSGRGVVTISADF